MKTLLAIFFLSLTLFTASSWANDQVPLPPPVQRAVTPPPNIVVPPPPSDLSGGVQVVPRSGAASSSAGPGGAQAHAGGAESRAIISGRCGKGCSQPGCINSCSKAEKHKGSCYCSGGDHRYPPKD